MNDYKKTDTVQRPKWDDTPIGGSRTPEPMDIWVGTQIRKRRLQLGWSTQQLGDECGITRQQEEKWETGVTRLVSSRLYEVAQALKVHPGYFFDGCGNLPVEKEMATELRAVSTAEGIGTLIRINALSRKQKDAILYIVDLMERAPAKE